jgi:hypothetical protein
MTHILGSLAHRLGQLNGLVQNVAKQVLLPLAIKEDNAIHHLKHDNAKRPPVDLGGERGEKKNRVNEFDV